MMLRHLYAAVILTVLFGGGSAIAQERKAYKYVDEKSNVTYSQTPPASGKDASRIDITPASSARAVSGPAFSWDNVTFGSGDRYGHEEVARQRARQVEDARQQRMTALQVECIQARGTDCKNPETLRYIEAQKIPGRGRR